MPISIDEYRYPKAVRIVDKEPFIEDSSAKFLDASLNNPIRRYRQESFPQQGYNPNSNVAIPRDVKIDKDEYVLPPY